MSKHPPHRPTPPDAAYLCNRPLQKLLSGFALIFFGASMMLPFKDDSVGLSAAFTVLGQPLTLPFWLFPICTLAFMRLIFRLHDMRLPILKAAALLLGMSLATLYLYFNRNGIQVGAGVALWLASGYLLTAAAIRWRYPSGGLLFSFSALVMAVSVCVWTQNLFKDGNGGQIWKTAADTPPVVAPVADTPPPEAAAPPAEETPVAVPEALDGLNRQSLIAVERDANLYNPWEENGGNDCESALKRNYPVLLPPRFSENGYEWHNYQHGDNVCNNLIYVGTPLGGKKPAFFYKITQDRRSNIYLVFSNAQGKPLFNETFSITRDNNGLKKSDYQKRLNAGFAKMVNADGTEQIDSEYVFAKAPAPTAADTLPRGCNWSPIPDQPNTFQWGSGRINWRGQALLHPQTFCSKNLLAVAHLSPQDNGKTANRLDIKLFRGKDLKPVECGALAVSLQEADTQAWLNGQLQADNLSVSPGGADGCLRLTVKLNDGRKLSSAVSGGG